MEAATLLLGLLAAAEADPPLSDLERFAATRETIAESLKWQREHRAWVTRRGEIALSIGHDAAAGFYGEWLRELDWIDLAYRRLDVAMGGSAFPWRRTEQYRREVLGRLRAQLGDEDYYAGRMPPPTTLWRMTRREP